MERLRPPRRPQRYAVRMETVCPSFGPCYQVQVGKPRHETPRQRFDRKHGHPQHMQENSGYRKARRVRNFIGGF